MRHPGPAQLVIASVATGGVATLGIAAHQLLAGPAPNVRQLLVAAVFGLMALISWLRPLIIYIGDESEAVHIDEGILVVLLLLVPSSLTIMAFALVTVVAQALMHRPLHKSTFNFGQMLIAVGVAEGVVTLARDLGPLSPYADAGAALLATAAFFVVTNAAITAILTAIGMPWKNVILSGLDTRVAIASGGLGIGLGTGLLLLAYPAALPLAVLPLVILRYALGGFFRARRDRARLEGLFRATLEANASMGQEQSTVEAGLLASARHLLRCPDAELALAPSDEHALRVPVPLFGQTKWLSVAGRSRTEPFDTADKTLLEALAAVAAGALSNTALYRRSERQKSRLAAITSSL
ncbi:MAG TPA: hypothetical protein VME46_21755, partial [Acidimicrobiales bacterium]|nr:hypothetical protein [Acidimicrobiales bacterium]